MWHFPSVSLPPRVSFLCWDATFPRFLQDLYLFYSKAKLGKETAGKGWSQPSSCVAWFYCCWNKGQGKEIYGKNPNWAWSLDFFTRSFHPCQQFLSYDSVVLKKLRPVGWWVFLRPYMGFEEQISMPESPGCKDWIMDHFSPIFTQTHRVLEQREDLFKMGAVMLSPVR